jgi:hypothetical protein
VVNQPQGQPQVRVETMAEGQQGRTDSTRQATAPQQQAARPADRGPQTTGAVPGAQALTVSQINRLNFYNAQGNELGDVERVVEGPDGKQYLVIGAGGFLGIGEKHVPIPLERVAVRGDRLVTQGLTEDQIRAMQTVDRNDRRFRELDGNQQVQINAMR